MLINEGDDSLTCYTIIWKTTMGESFEGDLSGLTSEELELVSLAITLTTFKQS